MSLICGLINSEIYELCPMSREEKRRNLPDSVLNPDSYVRVPVFSFCMPDSMRSINERKAKKIVEKTQPHEEAFCQMESRDVFWAYSSLNNPFSSSQCSFFFAKYIMNFLKFGILKEILELEKRDK
jgi:hypothetical protein